MSSTRLPGKVLLPLGKHTVLGQVIIRAKAIKMINEVVVATTNHLIDQAIVDECTKYDIISYRGSEKDVLSRYYEAAKERKADAIVRITSDCPLLDSEVSNEVVKRFNADATLDYCSNGLQRTFPRGLDTEVFTFEALEKAFLLAEKEFEREHVTPYLYLNPDKFKVSNVECRSDFSNYRWTLDTQEDWLLIQEIYQRLNIYESQCSWEKIIDLVKKHPELSKINAHIEQKKLGL
jgi:spore coat polysaccharide biosynthesis protein SpsF